MGIIIIRIIISMTQAEELKTSLLNGSDGEEQI